MIDIQLKNAAEEFVRYLRSSRTVKEFQTVQGIYQNNPEIKKLREEYISLSRQFQQKQSAGTQSPGDIDAIRKIQKSLSGHPVSVRYAKAQQAMIMLMQNCNGVMSEVLGFDFAATAAPAASCCG